MKVCSLIISIDLFPLLIWALNAIPVALKFNSERIKAEVSHPSTGLWSGSQCVYCTNYIIQVPQALTYQSICAWQEAFRTPLISHHQSGNQILHSSIEYNSKLFTTTVVVRSVINSMEVCSEIANRMIAVLSLLECWSVRQTESTWQAAWIHESS